jgi:hypothetical protein
MDVTGTCHLIAKYVAIAAINCEYVEIKAQAIKLTSALGTFIISSE